MLKHRFATTTAGVWLFAACATVGPAREREKPSACTHTGECPRAHTCRYRSVEGKQIGECQLDVGYCYGDWDCAPTGQRCQRFNAGPGTCVMSGL
jgi:hypothetical protein